MHTVIYRSKIQFCFSFISFFGSFGFHLHKRRGLKGNDRDSDRLVGHLTFTFHLQCRIVEVDVEQFLMAGIQVY